MGKLFRRMIAVPVAAAAAAFALNAPATLTARAVNSCGINHDTELNAEALGENNTLISGKYYLEKELKLNGEIVISTGAVTVCLNGNNITADGSSRVFNVNSGATLILCDCKNAGVISGGNVGEGQGGGVYIDKSTFILNGGTISGNKAKEGAGVYVCGENSKLEMNGGKISGNIASYQGGGVSINLEGSFEMSGGEISGNEVTKPPNNETDYGGAGVYTAGKFTMDRTAKISNNTAHDCLGGGVCVSGSEAVFTLKSGTLSGNSALHGGGVHVCSHGKVEMSNGAIIEKNEARGGGGGVSVEQGEFTMNGGTISDNTSKFGGGTYLTNSNAKFKLQGGTISNNEAHGEGGAGLYMSAGNFDMTGGTISNNKATDTGNGGNGGVYLGGGTLTMTGGAISGNSAKLGSCVYLDTGGTLVLNGPVTITSGTSSNVYLKKDKVITIGSGFSTVNKIGIHPEVTPDCKVLVPATTFAAGVPPTDIGDKFKADLPTQTSDYYSTTNRVELKGDHQFDKNTWKYDTEKEVLRNDVHWYNCKVCDLRAGDAPHRWDNGVITKPATPDEDGEKKFTCYDCGATLIETYSINDPITPPAPTPPTVNQTPNNGGNKTPDNDRDERPARDPAPSPAPDKDEHNSVMSEPDNPPTGINLALAPAALALIAAGTISARKRR